VLPSVENLRCFLLAARLLNFRKAARPAGLTPTAFGQRIRQLEGELGVELLRRTTRSVTLTEAGVALLPHAELTIAAAEECVRSTRGNTAPPAPIEIVLGTRYELGISWILPQYETIVRARPGLSLHLYFGAGPDLLLRVRTMEVDCAVTSSRLVDPKLDSARLHEEEYVLCGARTLFDREPLEHLEQFANHTLLDTGPDLPLFRYWKDAHGEGNHLRFGRWIYLGTVEAIRQRVLAGAGVAVLPAYVVRRELEDRTLVRALPSVEPLSDYFKLVFRADDPRRHVFESIARTLLETPLG
jgi:LysR family glycine cleavage system transcriptional activator